MAKLNLHLHTEYSDGRNTMKEMAVEAKIQGHVALVTSDHDYCMKSEDYTRQRIEAIQLYREVELPIICALEISLWSEEAVLVGRDACIAWIKFREAHKLKTWTEVYRFHPPLDEIKELLKPFTYGLCLVHPGCAGDAELYRMFDCYEVMNAGHAWPQDYIDKLKILAPQAKPVNGIDAHSADGYLKDPRCLCNEVEAGEAGSWTEAKIIEWMKLR
jgi:hypothetical protein